MTTEELELISKLCKAHYKATPVKGLNVLNDWSLDRVYTMAELNRLKSLDKRRSYFTRKPFVYKHSDDCWWGFMRKLWTPAEDQF